VGKLPTMASIRRGRGDSWEIRESVRTDRGPRSRTLATFKRLGPQTIERARERACKPLDPDDLIAGALRAGAPVEPSPADAAASALLAELSHGRHPKPALARALAERLGDAGDLPDSVRAAAHWAGRSAAERGEALLDLLLLADALPASRPDRELDYPRLVATEPSE
jgi:hypothetical protein